MIDYSDILRAFVEAKVDFTIIGGFAVLAHGVVRVTMDLDLAISMKKEDLQKSWRVLKSLNFFPRQPIVEATFTNPQELLDLARNKNMKAVSFYHQSQSYLIVDLLFEKEFIFKDSERTAMEIFGVKCNIASVDKLISLKSLAGREKDLEDIRELKKITNKSK